MRDAAQAINGLAAWPGPRTAGRDLAPLASDLLPPLDFLCLLFAAWLSSLLDSHWLAAAGPAATGGESFLRMVLFVAVLAPFVLYDPHFGARSSRGHWRAVTHSFGLRLALLSCLLLVLGAITRAPQRFPHHLLAIWFAAGLLLVLFMRIVAAWYVRRLQSQGALTESIAVVGAGPAADSLVSTLRNMQPETIEFLGVFDDQGDHGADGLTRPDGTLAQLLEMGHRRRINWILLALPPTADQRALSLVERLKILSVPIGLCPQPVGNDTTWRSIHYITDGLPVSVLADRPIRHWHAVLKAAEDLLGGAIITLLLLPVLAAVALAVRLTGPGPVIFRQRRHALDNREFDIYKFRTMHWAPATPTADLQQTTRLDARITGVGRFLRATSLDELPQLFNVLKGDMSLVGPRPHAINMRTEARLGTEITDLYAHRHRVKPGMTGWSQVNGARGATATTAQLRRRVELDLYYIEHWSLALDLKILALTIREVLKRTNAY